MIRVLVKASSAIARAGLESLLRGHAGLQLAVEQPRGARHSQPDVETPQTVLVAEADTLADASAREAIEWAAVGAPVVLLLRNPAPESVTEALRAGVKAVLPASLPGPEIARVIETVAAGLVVLDGAGLEALLPVRGPAALRGAPEPVEPLTAREVGVLRLVAAGLGNKEIASRLGITDHTVKFHVASIMGKLGAASRTEAVTLGIRHGLVMV